MRVWWRPIAVTHQVASSGSAPTAAIRLCEVAASAPGQPTTMLIRSGDGRTPRRAKSSAASMCPISKASISSGMPSSAARAAMPSVSCGSVGKRSRPKFSEPVSMPLMSGRASRPVERCSIVMPMAPPVETIVTMSQASRIWSMAALNSSAEALGVPSASRTCRCATAAPAAWQAATSAAISSGVYGTAGLCSRVTSAPVGATTMTTGCSAQRRSRSRFIGRR